MESLEDKTEEKLQKLKKKIRFWPAAGTIFWLDFTENGETIRKRYRSGRSQTIYKLVGSYRAGLKRKRIIGEESEKYCNNV